MIPAPHFNLARAVRHPVLAVGDYEGGTEPDQFTLAAHGLLDGDKLWLLYTSAAGVVSGELQTVFIVKKVNDNVFQLTTDGTTVVENSADGSAFFLDVTYPQRKES